MARVPKELRVGHWACDFFCVRTVLFQALHAFFVVRHANREIRHAELTRRVRHLLFIIGGDRIARLDRELHAVRRCLCLRMDAEIRCISSEVGVLPRGQLHRMQNVRMNFVTTWDASASTSTPFSLRHSRASFMECGIDVGPTERMDQFIGGFVCRRCRRAAGNSNATNGVEIQD